MFHKIFLSWLMAVTAEYLLLPGTCRRLDGTAGIARMSGTRVAVVFLFLFFALSCFSRKYIRLKWKSIYERGILFAFILLAAASLRASFSPAFFAACCFLFFRLLLNRVPTAPAHGLTGLTKIRQIIIHSHMFIHRITCRFPRKGRKIPVKHLARGHQNTAFRETAGKRFLRITVILSALFFLFLSLWTVSRVSCFSAPTYDFGIFSQMFYYMKTTGLPYTTLERDGLLSHFHVHISPVYYLLLPFYCLAPAPATLQILQAAAITSAVIPLWKLGGHHGLTPFQRMLLCTLLLLYPAFSGGVAYDIHENCFLTPLLLWLFYGIARKNSRLTAAAALLTMLVKEDAPVYVACIALWLSVSSLTHRGSYSFSWHPLPHSRDCHSNNHDNSHAIRPDRWGITAGAAMLSASLAYFFAATGYLALYGDGIMTARYDNFFYENGSSLGSLVKTAFVCPMKIIYECTDIDKLSFMAVTILPLLGLPLITRRWERYVLLIPYILINLMPDYSYQHDIFFQYVFGSAACLLYLTVMNLEDLRLKAKHPKTAALTAIPAANAPLTATAPEASSFTTVALTAAVAVCAVCFAAVIVPKAVSYPSRYIDSRDHYQELCRTLSQIPDEASVTASTFYTVFLSQRDTLYDIRYASREHLLRTEFVVFNPSSENDLKPYAGNGKTGYEGLTELLRENGYQLYLKSGAIEIYRQSQSATLILTPALKTESSSGSLPPDSMSPSDTRSAVL